MDEYINEYKLSEVETELVDDVGELNRKYSTLVDGLKMNISSVSENLDELTVYLRQISFEFDVVVLTETFRIWSTDLFTLPGYDVVYNEGNVNKNDGVVVYIKNTLEWSHRIVSFGEMKVLQIVLVTQGKKIILTAIYRPHEICPFAFNTKLCGYLKTIKRDFDYSIVIGDININILGDKDFIHQYLNILHEEGYVSQINNYTRVTKNTKSCIDHVFLKKITSSKCDLSPIIFKHLITDHYPIALIMDFKCSFVMKEESRRHRYVIDHHSLKQQLQTIDWDEVYSQNSVENITNAFVSVVRASIQQNTRQQICKRDDIPRKDWITAGLLKSIQIKNNLYKTVLKNPQNLQYVQEYKTYKNLLTKLIKTAKIQFYTRELDKHTNNTKRLWDCVKNICGSGTKRGNSVAKVRRKNGTITENKQSIAETFNRHYVQYSQELSSKIDRVDYVDRIQHLNESLFFAPLIEPETIQMINRLKNNKSPGLDGIKSHTLKEIKNEIAAPFTFVINRILESGIWPTCFGTGVIQPVFKSGDPLDVVNYRPITLISNLAKVAEMVVKNRIVNFLDKHNILSDRQFGFRGARSTQDAIAHITSEIYSNVDKNKPTMCIFVDLAKAFDTVNHDILVEKMRKYGFRGAANSLIRTYLHNRSQCVRIDGILSSSEAVTCGIPQGTVLGPVLFNLYINDLLMMETRGDIISYADDTAVVYQEESWEKLKETAENDFLSILSWLNRNQLTLNSFKTTFLCFSSYPRPTFDAIVLKDKHNDMVIKSSDSVKYLGIIIDSHLKWRLHTSFVIKKLRCLLPKFRALRDYLDIGHLKMLYSSLVQTHLVYGIIGWGGAYKHNLGNLETIQKWLLKVIFRKPKLYPSDQLYAEAGVFDVRQLFAYAVLCRQYLHGDDIELLSHSYNTRRSNMCCRTTRCLKTIGQRCYTYIGQKLFNSVPETVRNSRSFFAYKKEVKKWLSLIARRYIHDLIDGV